MRSEIFTICAMLSLCSCNMNHDNQSLSKKTYSELNNCFEDTLVSKSDCEFISGMELTIEGEARGKGVLTYSHYPFSEATAIKLDGNANQVIKSEWYDERCLIKYEPEDSLVTGKIAISFRVY